MPLLSSQAAERGPHPVGVLAFELESPAGSGRKLPVEVWYPAAGAHAGDDLSAAAAHPFGQPHLAAPGAAAAPGEFPLLAFSHGNSGLRQQSTFLTTHLASHGHVVAAPDHVGNTFFEMLDLDEDQRKAVHLDLREWRPLDLRSVVDQVLAGVTGLPRIDAGRVGVLGHSFGGWTAFKSPAIDPRVRAVCGLAPASEPFVGRKAFAPGELPLRDGLDSLVIAGRDDVLVDLETSVRPLFARLGESSRLLVIDGADHFHFCDGIPLLHQSHFDNPRPNQSRPTRPLADLLPQDRMHRLLRALVTRWFAAVFDAQDDPLSALDVESVTRLDGAVSVGPA
ncbi:MAG: hypothetical protein JRG76_10650 [Deltaproteobacteria bacterium]|nr:hypothetical protein [Deltaproteobacteria bacterium]MBW2414957.1 hypothetical protein [Deltaproteobacteria bacterium]